MGLDLFLHCYRKGEPATFKRALAEEILSRDAIDYRPPLHDVTYADGSRAQITGADDEDVHDLMFTHCRPGTFLERLYELANRTRSVVLWPFGSPESAVTDTETIAEVPSAFREEPFGPPFIVGSGREIYEAILRSGSADASKA
ncbi:MAG TPA: hypothetical protein VJN67_02125 [Stellaceae bacterium]|nr:hypothetical protein [Stellaceae bacterium]